MKTIEDELVENILNVLNSKDDNNYIKDVQKIYHNYYRKVLQIDYKVNKYYVLLFIQSWWDIIIDEKFKFTDCNDSTKAFYSWYIPSRFNNYRYLYLQSLYLNKNIKMTACKLLDALKASRYNIAENILYRYCLTGKIRGELFQIIQKKRNNIML